MAFAPSVYGELTATVLNTMAERYELRGDRGNSVQSAVCHTITEPEGTRLEADILLSCSNIGRSALNQTLRYVDPEDELFGVEDQSMQCFFRDPAQFEAMVEKSHGPHGQAFKSMVLDAKKSVISTVLECRRSIRQIPVQTLSGPVFSDGLFGPHVAKVMNSLLEAEIDCTENYGVYESPPPSEWFLVEKWRQEKRVHTSLVSLVQSDAQSLERRSFAQEKGTAFAGDMLVRMHAITFNHDKFEGGSVAARKVREALFPVFQYSPSGVETPNISFRKAFHNVRLEMDFVHRIVHGEVLPFLMAAGPRLGRESPLRDVDVEVMRIIAHFVIFGQ